MPSAGGHLPVTLTMAQQPAIEGRAWIYGLFAVLVLVSRPAFSGQGFKVTAGLANNPAIHFLDIGEGSAVWLEDGSGNNILIDTGNPVSGNRVSEILKWAGVKDIDTLIITHPHPDHMGGVFHILPHFHVHHLYDNGQPIPSIPGCDIYRWYAQVFRSNKNYKVLKRGGLLGWHGVSIKVLWPCGDGYSRNWNENSLVLKVMASGKDALLMGDATSKVEGKLLGMNPDILKADLLMVGHHGADDATSQAFPEAVDPKWAIIPVNKDNIRGYPASRVLKRLHDNGTEVYLLYVRGDCTWKFKDGGPQCSRGD